MAKPGEFLVMQRLGFVQGGTLGEASHSMEDLFSGSAEDRDSHTKAMRELFAGANLQTRSMRRRGLRV